MVRRAQALARPLCVAHKIVMGREELLEVIIVIDDVISRAPSAGHIYCPLLSSCGSAAHFLLLIPSWNPPHFLLKKDP